MMAVNARVKIVPRITKNMYMYIDTSVKKDPVALGKGSMVSEVANISQKSD